MKTMLFADTVTNVVLTVLIAAATLLVALFLFFRVRREKRKVSEQQNSEGTEETLAAFYDYLDNVIKTLPKKHGFLLFAIDIADYDVVEKAMGETQYANYLKTVTGEINSIRNFGVKTALCSKERAAVFVRNAEGQDIDKLSSLIVNIFTKPNDVTEMFNIDVSVNCASVSYPDDGLSAEQLFRNIDIAMVSAKRKGVNTYTVYNERLGVSESAEYKFYEEIKAAIKAKEFILYYQPVVDSSTLEVYGGEALMRWSHKTKGVLPPSDFLYVMEQTGDIVWVGYWCFEQLVKQQQNWKTNYENKLRLSLNLSERQLMEVNLADELKRIVIKYRCRTDDFIMEIAAETLTKGNDTVIGTIAKLAQYGFGIAVDGFGDKFGSLSRFEEYPLEFVKVERSFWIDSAESGMKQGIISALLGFSKEKQTRIAALGVEKRDEVEYLRSIGVKYMQGYAFSKPTDAKEFISEAVLTPWTADIGTAAQASFNELTPAEESESGEKPVKEKKKKSETREETSN